MGNQPPNQWLREKVEMQNLMKKKYHGHCAGREYLLTWVKEKATTEVCREFFVNESLWSIEFLALPQLVHRRQRRRMSTKNGT